MTSYPFPVFFIVWAAIGIIGFFLFYISKDAAFKRRWFPWYAIFAGVVFGSFVVSDFHSAPFPVFPMIALITFLNIKFTKFCDACGVTITQRNWWTKLEYCPACGAELNASDRTEPKSKHRQVQK